ncbi:MAG: nucleotidyl transferase AbiEii/AbiGii toxin family protein [Candidatus Thermoplasmatota archaeon]
MLSRGDLERLRSVLGYTLGQVEKDYIQHMFLLHLYKDIKDELVFKGGTCLQKIYGLGRFSEDLDFTVNGPVDIEKSLARTRQGMSRFGCLAEIANRSEDDIRISVRIKTRGPLYDGTELSQCSLRLEASKREKVLLPPVIKTISPVYEDMPFYSLPTMDLEEILAEKVRGLLTRDRARDAYDLYYLVKKGVSVRRDIIEKKLEYYGLSFDIAEVVRSISGKRKVWVSELKPLITHLPNFEEVEKTILDKVRGH